MLSGDEAELLQLGMDAEYYETKKRNSPDELFRLLLDWTGRALTELAQNRLGQGA